MAQGIRGHIGIKKETTWGEKVVGANDFFLPFSSETLTANIEELLSAAQRGILDEPKSYQGEKSFAGDVVVEVHPTSIGHILRSALGVPGAASAPTTSETVIEDCEDAWNQLVDGGVISTVDAVDKKKGSNSVKLLISADVGAGDILATELMASTDMTLATHIKLWIKSSVDITAGDLHLLLDDTPNCATPLETLDIGALTAGVWTEKTLTIITPAGLGAVVSIGLKMTVEEAEHIIHLDDIRMVTTTAAGTAKQHIFTPMQLSTDEFHADCPLFPYTFEVYRDQGDAFQFLGGVVNTLALNFSTTDKILKATCGIIAKNLGSVEKTGLSLEPTKPFVWENAIISIGGSQNNNLESFGLTWDNKCVAKYFLNNTAIPGKIIRDGFRTIPVNFVIDFVDRTEYDYFILGTERAFQVKFVGAVCEAGPPAFYYTLTIDLPLVRYLAYPINIGGPGRLTCAVTGKAKYDAAGWALRATLINLKNTAEYAA